jgi:hypothetical protein
MNLGSTASIAIILIVAFFLIPYLPKYFLFLSDNIVVRIVLLFSLVGVANRNLPLGLLYFLVLANIFIQRNSQKVKQLTNSLVPTTEEDPAIENIRTPDTAPVQPVFENPSARTIPFMPNHESGDNSFRPVGESIDQKVVLPTESVDGSDKAIKQLFGWVDPTLAQS